MSAKRVRVRRLPLECWLVHGSDPRGGPYYARRFDEAEARDVADRMNRTGGRVEVQRQRREPGGDVWRDIDGEAAAEDNGHGGGGTGGGDNGGAADPGGGGERRRRGG